MFFFYPHNKKMFFFSFRVYFLIYIYIYTKIKKMRNKNKYSHYYKQHYFLNLNNETNLFFV